MLYNNIEMGLQQHYGGAIWTNHALERLEQRKLSQEMAWSAFQYPDNSVEGKQPGSIEYRKRYGRHLITVIAKQNEKSEWIILSCWVDPPMFGTEDYQKRQDYLQERRSEWKSYKPVKGFWPNVLSILKEIFWGR